MVMAMVAPYDTVRQTRTGPPTIAFEDPDNSCVVILGLSTVGRLVLVGVHFSSWYLETLPEACTTEWSESQSLEETKGC